MRFDAAAVMAEILSQETTPATSATSLPEPEKVVQADGIIENFEVAKPDGLATRLATFATRRATPAHPNPVRSIMERLEGDMERYAEALRAYGPMSYGQAMHVLGWGGTRAGQAESDLHAAGRIAFNQLGRAYLVDEEASHDE